MSYAQGYKNTDIQRLWERLDAEERQVSARSFDFEPLSFLCCCCFKFSFELGKQAGRRRTGSTSESAPGMRIYWARIFHGCKKKALVVPYFISKKSFLTNRHLSHSNPHTFCSDRPQLKLEKKKLREIWVKISKMHKKNEEARSQFEKDSMLTFVPEETQVMLNVGGQVVSAKWGWGEVKRKKLRPT